MKNSINVIELMEIAIQFNKLSEDIRKIIAESLNIVYNEDKFQKNQNFIRNLYELSENEVNKIKNIIDRELNIKINKTNEEDNNVNKNNKINNNNNKRNYIDFIKDKKESSTEKKS